MNKRLFASLIGALALATALPALAGPDFQAIEQARKARQASQAASRGDLYEAQGPTAVGPPKCPTEAPILQLDHGPRAQTTSYLNRLRQQRYEAQLAACKGTAR